MSPAKLPPNQDPKLVNNLTVADARHLLGGEGGPRTPAQLLLELASISVVSAFTARAIWVGSATGWHLALPMVAEYLLLLAAIPLLYLALRHPALRKEAVSSLRLWIGMIAVLAVVIAVRAQQQDAAWGDQLAADASLVWRWIYDAQMHWPILLACAAVALALPGRVRNLYTLGPPFVGVSLGCAMRVAVLVLGFMVLPWALENSTRMAWTLWAMIILAEILALVMLWDIQHRLAKIDKPKPKDAITPLP